MAAPETDEPRIIDLEEDDIWQDHKGKVLLAIAVTLIASLGGGWWYQYQTGRENAAWNAYGTAQTPETRGTLLHDYPGTSAAAAVLLQQAREAVSKNNYEAAAGHFKAFIASFPKHPSRAAADLGQAEATEAAGHPDQAVPLYQAIIDASPSHPYRGAAVLGLARVLKSQNKIADARRVLEDFVNNASLDPYFSEARRALTALPPAPSAQTGQPRPAQ
jgi:TolA-binding protein